MAEILDLVDANGNPLNRTIVRGEGIPAGSYVIVVNIMTVNSRGRILMTRRAPSKSLAGCWEITGGAKTAGETPAAAAVRELFEETGIRITEADLIYCGTERRTHWFNLYYLCFRETANEAIRLQPGETDGARWVTRMECLELVRADTRRSPDCFLQHYPQIFCKSTAKEQYDVYDAEKNRTGTVLGTDISPPPGTYKLLCNVMTVNSAGRILLTKRAENKTNPGKWELSGGHVQAGESAEDAAVRELFEETGIRAEASELEFRGDHKVGHCIFSLFLLRRDAAPSEIRLQPGETDDAKWVTPEELMEIHREGGMVMYQEKALFRYFTDILPQKNEMSEQTKK